MHWEDWPAPVSGPADGEQTVGVKFQDTFHSPVRGLLSLSESWLHPEEPLMVQFFSAFSSLD